MDLFVIQPTYSLHSLLRPNRLLARIEAGVDHQRSQGSARERQDANGEGDRALCDA